MKDDPHRATREALASIFNSQARKVSVKKEDLIASGKSMWEMAGQHTTSDQELVVLLHQQGQELLRRGEVEKATAISAILMLPDQQLTSLGASRWYGNGLPVIQMGHKYAAALMATNPGKGSLEELEAPWSAFVVDIPNGLLPVLDPATDKEANLTFLLVHRVMSEKRGAVWNYVAFSETAVTLWVHGAKTEELVTPTLGSEWDGYSFAAEQDDQDMRVQAVLGRLILGVCLATSGKDRDLKKVGAGHGGKKNGRRGEPTQRVFKLGKPIKLDCREPLTDYIKGRRSANVSVQTLVIGHWKRQAHGPQSSLRKWIWIEPFWRGPEDAPIVQRPHVL